MYTSTGPEKDFSVSTDEYVLFHGERQMSREERQTSSPSTPSQSQVR